jgi:hypothetical protein
MTTVRRLGLWARLHWIRAAICAVLLILLAVLLIGWAVGDDVKGKPVVIGWAVGEQTPT